MSTDRPRLRLSIEQEQTTPASRDFRTAASIPVEWEEGDVLLDLYEVKSLLGEGGMGKVYRIYHRGWDFDLAVKSPKEEFFLTEEGRETFIQEAETWVNLGLHPNTVSCYYVRTLGSIPRVFAECVDGGTLLDWVWYGSLYKGNPTDVLGRILDVAVQIAWGLDHAHEARLIHQDMKSSNVLMTPDGDAKVTDFGLARAMTSTTEYENPQDRILTPEYASPEQLEGAPLDRRSDLFSWAVVVLEMLTRQQPGYGPDSLDVLRTYQLSMDNGNALVKAPKSVTDLLTLCFQNDPEMRPDRLSDCARTLIEAYQEVTGRKYDRPWPVAAERHIDSLNNRAVSLFDLGQIDEARALLEDALRADANHLHANHNLALLRWRQGELKEHDMLRVMKDVRAANPSNWEEKLLMSWAHLERGDVKSARATLAEAAKAADTDFAAKRGLKQVETMLERCSRQHRVLLGHHDEVLACAITADGQFIVSGGKDTAVRFWEAESGQCLQMLAGHSAEVTGVCISPDARVAASASADCTIRVWRLSDGECVRCFNHGWSVRCVAISDDGQWLVAGSMDNTLSVWHVSSGKRIRDLTGHKEAVYAISLMPDGSMALSASKDGTLRLWDLAGGNCLQLLTGHAGEVFGCYLMPSGRYAASAGSDRTVRIWDVASADNLTLEGHTEAVQAVAVAPGPGILVSAGASSARAEALDSVRVWEVRTGRCIGVMRHPGGAYGAAVSGDGRWAVSAGADSTCIVWTLSPQQAPLALVQPRRSEEVLSIQSQYKTTLEQVRQAMQAGDWKQAVQRVTQARQLPGYQSAPELLSLWSELARRAERGDLRGVIGGAIISLGSGGGRAVWISPSGGRVVTSMEGKVLLSDAETGEKIVATQGYHPDPKAKIAGLACAGEGTLMATPDDDHSIKLWDLSAGKMFRVLVGHSHAIHALSLTTDGRLLASASADGTVRVWQISTGKCLTSLSAGSGWCFGVAITPDGRRIISAHSDKLVRVWDVANSRVVAALEGHQGVVTRVDITADGRRAVTASLDKRVRVWDLANGILMHELAHNGAVLGVCISADGRLVASASEDRTVKVWDADSGRSVHVIDSHRAPVTAVAITPNARRLVTTSEDQTTQVWNLDWNLVPRDPADWDERIRPMATLFLTMYTRPGGLLRKPQPTYGDAELRAFLTELGWYGYGWLRPDGVARELKKMASSWDGTVPFGA
ncbi:MAG: protein kinase domain-containing protein [Candidatus Xenobia bacterium]